MTKMTGRAKKYDGTAIDYVSIFNWSDGKCIAQVVPDSAGNWYYNYYDNISVGVSYIADGCEPITHGSYNLIGEWSPDALFVGGKQGVWYDPSDKSTLFQDVAGTVPVTKDGDPVALILDKSGNGNHATQTVSTSRPIYKTDGILHWLAFDGIDDSFSIPVDVSDKAITLSISYLKPLTSEGFILMDTGNGNLTHWAFIAQKNNTATTLISIAGGLLNYIKVDSIDSSPKTRADVYAALDSGNVITASAKLDSSGWGSYYGYGSYSADGLKGLRRTTGYVLVVGEIIDTTKLDNYLAKKSGVTL